MWLKCQVLPGQFSGEFAIRGKLFNNSDFSLFAERNDVKFTDEPSIDKFVDGWLKITVGSQQGDLLLVALPQPSFENGQTITVKRDQVREQI
jgi:hypothetical protein